MTGTEMRVGKEMLCTWHVCFLYAEVHDTLLPALPARLWEDGAWGGVGQRDYLTHLEASITRPCSRSIRTEPFQPLTSVCCPAHPPTIIFSFWQAVNRTEKEFDS